MSQAAEAVPAQRRELRTWDARSGVILLILCILLAGPLLGLLLYVLANLAGC